MDRSVDLRIGREFLALSQTLVSEVKGSDYLSFGAETKPEEILIAMKEKLCTEAYICDENQTLIGKVTIHSITGIENLSEGIDKEPIVIPSSSNLNQARSIASDFVGESIPVTEGGKLVSALTEGDIFTRGLEVEDKIRQHDSECLKISENMS